MISINQIIQRAKLQPRLGDDPNNSDPINISDSEKRAKKTAAEWEILSRGFGDAFKDINKTTENFIKTYEQFSAAIIEDNTNIQFGLHRLLGDYDTLKKSMVETVKKATELEQRNANLNKSLGITSKTAAVLGQRFDNIGVQLNIGGEQVRAYAESINKIIPGMSSLISKHQSYGAELMMTQNIIKDQLQLSDEQAQGFELYARGMGRSGIEQLGVLKAISSEFEKMSGMAGMFKDVTGEIASLGSDIRQAYGKLPGSLELAVMKSRMLGMSFSQMDAVATNMLNIEESVNQELEYQLLSGKRLADAQGNSLTEKLRMAKITGNANKIAEATAEIFETQSDILEGNNYYAKEALAKTMGMTTEQLMKAHETQKLIKSIPEFQGEAGKKKLDDIMSMKPEDFDKAIADMPKEKQKLYEQIKRDSDTRTTDQQLLELLDYKRTFKITTLVDDQEKVISSSKTKLLDPNALVNKMGKFLDILMGETETIVKDGKTTYKTNDALVKAVGNLGIKGDVYANFSTALESFTSKIPIFGENISNALSNLKSWAASLTGTTRKTESNTGNVGAAAVGKTNAKDAVVVNDAMIQFHPADKFATVPDGAALLASTERGKLDTAVDTLTGGGGKTAVIDPNPIAQAVAAAVQQAMAGVKLTLGGEQLVKGIEFDNRTIN